MRPPAPTVPTSECGKAASNMHESLRDDLTGREEIKYSVLAIPLSITRGRNGVDDRALPKYAGSEMAPNEGKSALWPGEFAPSTLPDYKNTFILSPGHSCARPGVTGTLSLQKALQALGYDTYHLHTLFSECGTPHIKFMIEAMRAKHFGDGKPFGREELDKWFADYDALTDVPGYLLEEMIAAYPEAKFILTTRDSKSWLKSIQATMRVTIKTGDSFPRNIMAFFDPYPRSIFCLTKLLGYYIWNGKGMDDDKAALNTFDRHNATAREKIPKDKLLVLQMEEGLGWGKICEFLGKDVPNVPFPHKNTPREYHANVRKASLVGSTVIVAKGLLAVAPVFGAVAWFYRYAVW
ncbi:hypothetical protein MKZ38_007220 [Zalerion maritima]|uniref:NAD dependent epimerase/dehydratase n=1 Tax=Zalerion maritima TaxID=339359 RepID=A0AAD5RJ03_9PEZI|nr:hypothetical protein MKZ38_007220 [Zalerion maritima]